jgi:hypothetical protein
VTNRHKDVILLTKMELSWFLPGASLGPQVKDHTIWFLSGASLGPQVKDHTTWFLPEASLGPQVKSSRRHSCHKDGVPRHQCHKDNGT